MQFHFHNECQSERTCSKSDRKVSQRHTGSWALRLFQLCGLVSLIWFLIRVIPKPSRATYPCQRVAFPLAAGFMTWLLGIAGSAVFYKKARKRLHQSSYLTAVVCIVLALLAISVPLSITDSKPGLAENARPPQAANDPIGVSKGIHPGRVVWVHDPDATDWNGPGDGHWFENTHTDVAVVENMFSQGISKLAGQNTDVTAWDTIFRHFRCG